VLHVHRSERADLLVDALATLLADPPDDVMAPEVVSVPTRGVERWLVQRLSTRLGTRPGGGDGVCANVDFPFPGSLVTTATTRACGVSRDTDPWLPERAVWPLMELVDDHLSEPFLAPLRRHLETISPPAGDLRRFATVRRIADLYDRYAVNRPDMLEAWRGGSPTWGAGGDEDEAWQAELWRRLRTRIGVPGPAERSATAAERLELEPELLDLPQRISLFGLTRLPASYLQILKSLAVGRDVHLFLLHPSPALWEKVRDEVPRPPVHLRRAEDPTSQVPANPLLRSWGRDAREMQLVLASQGLLEAEHLPVPLAPSTLLGTIQDDVRADRAPGTRLDGQEDLPLLADGDDSLRVHSCHGHARQVEVMRDAILHLLAADETLEPRDVVIMCPDIESFAPLVSAAFGAADDEPPGSPPSGGVSLPRLRVRLADRSLRQTNPLLAVAARLLALAAGRTTASDVLDLAACEAVSRRFRFDDDGLAQIAKWTANAGIRWGIDAEDRAPWQLEKEPANTWKSGLDRLLLGAAMTEDDLRLFGGVLPLDDVSGGSVELAGRLAEFVGRLSFALDALSGSRPLDAWVRALSESTDSLAVAAPHESWQHDQLHGLLDDVTQEAGELGDTVKIDLAEITALLEDRLAGRPTRANFRTGDLTICTLVPMRSVPHRVVGLLGLDDEVFPRPSPRDGDNLLLSDPRVGERDPRSEDRQLLLDALLAAGEHLVITYEGRDPHTNQPRPPAVPVSELLDVVDRTVRVGAPGARPRDRVVVEHPLQSFDPRNFTPGCLGESGPFGFDPLGLEGALSRTSPARPARPFLCGPLPPLESSVVRLDSLVRFLEHPVRAFLRERLRVYLGGETEVVKDEIPIDLDALESWGIGDRLLDAALDGVPMQRACDAERSRGLVPPGNLAEAVFERVVPVVEGLAGVAREHRGAGAGGESLPVHIELPGGRVLAGAVPGVSGGAILRVSYSKLGPKHRVGAWARFLALAASNPDRDVSAVTVGRGPREKFVAEIATLDTLDSDPGVAAERARTLLLTLVDLFDRGMREPLPLYCATSAAWAMANRDGRDAVSEAEKKWTTRGDYGGRCEDADAYHAFVLGTGATFDSVREAPPADDERGEGWPKGKSRFCVLAQRLWDPILDHERRACV
jgi:exodeoxyribonuclease V gamma subunit